MPEASRGLGPQKTLALVAGGVGLVSLGVGAVFGLATLSKKNDAQATCPDLRICPTQNGADLWNEAVTDGNIANPFFVVGGLGVAAGAVLWLTAKPTSPSTPNAGVGFGPGSIHLKGTW